MDKINQQTLGSEFHEEDQVSFCAWCKVERDVEKQNRLTDH